MEDAVCNSNYLSADHTEGDIITLSAEDAAQLIQQGATQLMLQHQDLGDGTVTIAPGTYQILNQNGTFQLAVSDAGEATQTFTVVHEGEDSQILSGEHSVLVTRDAEDSGLNELVQSSLESHSENSQQELVSRSVESDATDPKLNLGESTVATDIDIRLGQNDHEMDSETVTKDTDTNFVDDNDLTSIESMGKTIENSQAEELEQNLNGNNVTHNEENLPNNTSNRLDNNSTDQNDAADHTESNIANDDTTMLPSSTDSTSQPEKVKQVDLSRPITVTTSTEVIINGKKCALMVNPSTGELCAYPVIPPPNKRKRGRPRREERNKVMPKEKSIAPHHKPKVSDQTSSAAEVLLELGNTDVDGVRRSRRSRKPAKTLEDYEVDNLEDEDDLGEDGFDSRKRQKLDDMKEYVPNVSALVPKSDSYTPKRGRGRPRRYPDTNQSPQLSALVMPGMDGTSLLVTPVQGLNNLRPYQDQMKTDSKSENSLLGSDQMNDSTVDNTDLSLDGVDPSASLSDGIGGGDTDEGVKLEDLDGDQQNGMPIPCKIMPIMFNQKKDPIKIGLKSSEKELEKLKCPKCDFQAYYSHQYQSHIATHADDVHKCKCCQYISFSQEQILSHFKQSHPRCICPECDFMAEHAYMIKRHMMRHTEIGCKCNICGRVYKDQYILKMHVKMVHMPAEVLFECIVCTKKFTRKAHLKRHMRIHEPEKPFKCPMCEYRGCERSDLSKHILIHEEPKHVCEVCGKAFRHIKNKELHLKRHNGQKDYKCGVCDFYGYTFTDIRKHIERKHSDIKALVCDKCGSAFKSEHHLRDHQSRPCEVVMIEQALAIANSSGGTSQATIQIPSNLSLSGQQITIDGNENVNIMVHQVMNQQETDEEVLTQEEEAVVKYSEDPGSSSMTLEDDGVTHQLSNESMDQLEEEEEEEEEEDEEGVEGVCIPVSAAEMLALQQSEELSVDVNSVVTEEDGDLISMESQNGDIYTISKKDGSVLSITKPNGEVSTFDITLTGGGVVEGSAEVIGESDIILQTDELQGLTGTTLIVEGGQVIETQQIKNFSASDLVGTGEGIVQVVTTDGLDPKEGITMDL